MELLTPPPLPGTAEFDVVNPTPGDTLLQTPSALRKVKTSSQNNLAGLEGNTTGLPDLSVPPTITPQGMKAGVGAIVKMDSSGNETQMETDKPNIQSLAPIMRSHVPAPHAAKSKDYILPSQADEAGKKRWKDKMLSGHPGGRATSFEQWGQSYVIQFKTVIDAMSQSLRIKEYAGTSMFSE